MLLLVPVVLVVMVVAMDRVVPSYEDYNISNIYHRYETMVPSDNTSDNINNIFDHDYYY